MDEIILTLKALADETRFRIINLLLVHDLCVGALADRLDISKAAVSQHLQILRKAGLVTGEKRGYWTHYRVDKDSIIKIAQDLIDTTVQSPDTRKACERSLPDEIENNDMERRQFPMCNECCQKPHLLEIKPEKCSPEQIRECHGDENEHPCVPEKEEK